MLNGVSHVENLVGDFGRASEVPGDNGAVSRVPARSVGAAQKLGAFPEEEDVQGLLDSCLVASHHLQEQAPIMLVSPRNQGPVPAGRATKNPESRWVQSGQCGEMPQAEQPKPWSWGLVQGNLGTLLLYQANVYLPWDLPHNTSHSLASWPHPMASTALMPTWSLESSWCLMKGRAHP